MNSSNQTPNGRKFSRDTFVTILLNAFSVREYRFVRLAALNWLAIYPGDLPIRYLYAKALVNENRLEPAIAILDDLCQSDPEFSEAIKMKLQVESLLLKQENPPVKKSHLPGKATLNEKISDTSGWLNSLGYPTSINLDENYIPKSSSWNDFLQKARQALQKNDGQVESIDEAEQFLHQILATKPTHPLVAQTHLSILRAQVNAGMSPPQALRSLAEHYYAVLPNCLPAGLFLAEALMESGEPEKAVALLHQCASHDVTGQVATRLWGKDHPYQKIWPSGLEITLDIPIPAAVAAALGWNQLPIGESQTREDSADSYWMSEEGGLPGSQADTLADSIPDLDLIEESIIEREPIGNSTFRERDIDPNELSPTQPVHLGAKSKKESDDLEEILASIEYDDPSLSTSLPQILQPAKEELYRLGFRLNRPDLAQADARFPVYVVLTTWEGLVSQYGQESARLLEMEMLELVSALQYNKKWDALLFYADQGKIMPSRSEIPGLQPASYNDPRKITQALTDLDENLRKAGEMIGALLIVGSPQVVPFHHLPNPTEDDDPDVPSDNPYGSRDGNSLNLEWPVGRLPGAEGEDLSNPAILLETMREISNRHRTNGLEKGNSWYSTWLRSIFGFLHFINKKNGQSNGTDSSFGYTAAAWRMASFSVFRQIGNPKKMLISPAGPFTRNKKIKAAQLRQYQPRGGAKSVSPLNDKRLTEKVKIPPSKLGYFNLHGTLDAVEWFGQIDPEEAGFEEFKQISELPVALHPGDIGADGSVAPKIVFSEACYSAHTYNRSVEESLALKFLQGGCQAFVGSTCTSYGSTDAPLVAADLLAHGFWKAIRDGFPAGEALNRAKFSLTQEMTRRNGYLDGGDQKTLISFVLYGDPLAQLPSSKAYSKSTLRYAIPERQIQAVCDLSYDNVDTNEVTPTTLQYIKKVVEKYLPGMEQAEISLKKDRISCLQKCRNCNTHTLQSFRAKSTANSIHGINPTETSPHHRIVILKKPEPNTYSNYHRFARLTLDEKGNLVKLVISR